jgi:hypothetical protein
LVKRVARVSVPRTDASVSDRWDRLFAGGLVALTVIDLGLFAHYLRATVIRLPFSDMYSYVLRYLQYRQDGHFWAFLWAPHNQHRLIWMRLLTAFDARVFGGVAYPFIVFASACQLLTAGLLARELLRVGVSPDLRRAGACLVVMLVLTSVSAVDCSIPIFGVYPPAVAFAVLALVLSDGAGGCHRLMAYRRGAALVAASAAGFANAAGLAIWPILLWSAWRGRAGARWTALVAGVGVGFVAIYLHGLPLPHAAANPSGSAARPVKMFEYLLTYMGLPWTRAATLATPGRSLGALLLIISVWVVLWRGLLGPAGGRLERLAVGLLLFSLASAVLAVLGRVDVDQEVKVPVRYAVFIAPLHVALLWMVVPWLARQWPTRTRRRLLEAGMFACALMLVVQQVVAGQAAVHTTRIMVTAIERFLAGERDAGTTKIIDVDLDVAQHAVDVIRSAGIYIHQH